MITVRAAKKRILAYVDFYGGSVVDTEAVEKATTLKQLSDVLNQHRQQLLLEAADAVRDVDRFKSELFGNICL